MCVLTLSCVTRKLEQALVLVEPEVDDKAHQINVINSRRMDNRPNLDKLEDERRKVAVNRDILEECEAGVKIKALRKAIEAGQVPETCTSKYNPQIGLLYYLSNRDEESKMRLYLSRVGGDR